MGRLSSMRNDSRTAFLIHWWTIQVPSRFSATRSVPSFSCAITAEIASRSAAGALAGESAARSSQAWSMVCCRDVM